MPANHNTSAATIIIILYILSLGGGVLDYRANEDFHERVTADGFFRTNYLIN